MKKLNRSPQRKNKIIFEGFFFSPRSSDQFEKKNLPFLSKISSVDRPNSEAGRRRRRIKRRRGISLFFVFLTWNWPQIDSTWIILPSSPTTKLWLLTTDSSLVLQSQHVTMDFQILDILLPVFFREIVITPARHLHA